MATSQNSPDTTTQKQILYNENLFPASSDAANAWATDPATTITGYVANKLPNPNDTFRNYILNTFASPDAMDTLYSVFGDPTQSGPTSTASFEKGLIDNLISQHQAANAAMSGGPNPGYQTIPQLGGISLNNQHDVGQTIANALTGTNDAAGSLFYSQLQTASSNDAVHWVDSLVKVLGANSMSSDVMKQSETELSNLYAQFLGMEQGANNYNPSGLDFANFLTYNAAAWLNRWFGDVQIGTPPPAPKVGLPNTPTGSSTNTVKGTTG